MEPKSTYKPNFHAFVTFRYIGAIIFNIVLLIIGLISFTISASIGLILLAVFIFSIILNIIGFWFRTIQYKKEIYEIYEGSIIRKYGSLFSDGQVELKFKNVTLVENVKPFIRRILFNVGDVRVEAAGSQESEIYFSSLDESDEAFQIIKKQMSLNGFDLNTDNLRVDTRPSVVGVIINSIVYIIQGTFFILFIAINFAAEDIDFGFSLIAFGGLLLVAIILGSPFLILQYIDLLRRRYKIFDKIMTYHEGFLTTHEAFIAAQNLADVHIGQNFLQKLFGIYSVGLSSQGQGKELKFKNIREGKLVERELDRIINSTDEVLSGNTETTVQENVNSNVEQERVTSSNIMKSPQTERDVRKGTEYTLRFRMNPIRVIFLPAILSIVGSGFIALILFAVIGSPFLILLVFIPLFFSVIGTLITYYFTNYEIKKASFSSNFSFLVTKNIEFSADKVTAVIVNRNILDMLIGTMTMKVMSIGSGENIIYSNVTYDEIFISEVLKKLNLERDEENLITQYRSNFGIYKWLMANIYTLPASILLIIIILVSAFSLTSLSGDFLLSTSIVLGILLILAIVYIVRIAYLYWYYSRSKLNIYRDFVEYRWGIFFQGSYYAEFEDIKDIQIKKYPTVNTGEVKFNVAGDFAQVNNNNSNNSFASIFANGSQQQASNSQYTFVSNSFTIKYIDEISSIDDTIDTYLLHQPEDKSTANKLVENFSTDLIMDAKPVVMQTVIFPYFISIVLIPLIPLAALAELMKSYRIEKNRVVANWGIIFKYQKSILHKRLDFINKNENLPNKIFGTGNIQLNTVGSTSIEMTINNIKEKEEFYKKLKEVYEN